MKLLPFFIIVLLTSCSCASAIKAKLDQPIVGPPQQARQAQVPKHAQVEQKDVPVSGVVPITTDIKDEDVAPVFKLVDKLEERGDKVVVFLITTNGGSPEVAYKLVRRMETLNRNGIKTVCIGDDHVMSAGIYILEGCQERWATKRTTFLTHEVAMNGGPGERGTRFGFRRMADILEKMTSSWNEFIARRLKITIEEYNAKVADKDWTFNWKEALDVGFIDKVIEPEDIPVSMPLEPVAPVTLEDQLKLLLR